MKIQQKLIDIAQQGDLKILFACESGSRAWGFPSPDSDYDVRFIYVRPSDDYLSIKAKKDHMGFAINDELDLYGWDLQKVLQLIFKSNTTPFEWLQSPIVYSADNVFKENLWQLCHQYFCAKSNVHHYLGVARGAMETIVGQEIKIKKMFYVLRPVLAALWCVERKEIAPMSIFPLMDLLSQDLRGKISSMIALKAEVNEGYLIRIDSEISAWIDRTMDHCMELARRMEKRTVEPTALDVFFRKIIFST